MTAIADHRFMGLALAMAHSQLGRTAPNPAVGCVLVAGGRIVATGATADGGRPHAERVALEKATGLSRGCTAYVTLEPCAHHGRTPPCAEALIAAGVARVVIACLDRYHEVDGRGVSMLEAAGIAVETGLGEAGAAPLYAGFFHRLETGRPLVFADTRRTGYDATVEPVPDSDLEAALEALGSRGCSRVRVEPGTPFATALIDRGLARPAGCSRNTLY